MENASKALIMAGGILIALLVIGALLLMLNQISSYQKSESVDTKTQQLADFNKEYAQFTYDDIQGYEVITLINKVVDFNSKTGVANSVDYSKKITVNVTLGSDFAKAFGVNNKLNAFSTETYSIKDKSNSFFTVINDFSSLERQYTLAVMSKLSANYDSIKNEDKTIKEVIGKDINIDIKQIEKYREYSEFKSSKFTSVSEPIYSDGQIVGLSFKYKK